MDRTHHCGDFLHGLHGWQRNISFEQVDISPVQPYLAFMEASIVTFNFTCCLGGVTND